MVKGPTPGRLFGMSEVVNLIKGAKCISNF